jgi:hypothetical protein
MNAKRGHHDAENDSSSSTRRQLHYLADEAWGALAGDSDDSPPAHAVPNARKPAVSAVRPESFDPSRAIGFRATLRMKCVALLRRLQRSSSRGRNK